MKAICIMNKINPIKRNTKQRTIILEELEGNKCHPTADEIYEKVRRKMPKISLSTVYRNLEILRREGVVQVIDTGGGQRRYDYITSEHSHIRCIRCGKLEDIVFEKPQEVIEDCAGQTDNEVLGCNVDIYGICPECKFKLTIKEE
jgi:Fur family ferric uptake transcriptional regulator